MYRNAHVVHRAGFQTLSQPFRQHASRCIAIVQLAMAPRASVVLYQHLLQYRSVQCRFLHYALWPGILLLQRLSLLATNCPNHTAETGTASDTYLWVLFRNVTF